ncbi:polyprenyl synthetase family protein [Paenibacillus sp. GP183]|uniref:polyprenyl synthetase family protein n=1 Tax=Paenibacillus sp. GP183 TaxID=1882751 RepID=UPI00089C574D|nr:polyprenyl synthetase family protein [Paenibacillus sp. GP183]SEB89420.1 competence protein ComQ [Paenibacillus sp. GP183]
MEHLLQKEMKGIVNHYYPMPLLNELLQTCIDSKAEEKTIWSNLTIYTHRMLGGNNPFIPKLAAITELVILGLDIMDDLQDQDNPEKPWMQQPQELVLNAMVALFMAASAELGALSKQNPELTLPDAGELSRLISVAINGQHTDLMLTVETEEEYVNMVQQKSCVLIRIAFYIGIGAIPSLRISPSMWDQLNHLADYIGMIAQINNDISDLLRMDIKNDLFKKKRTLPILYLLEESDSPFPQLQQYFDGTITLQQLLQKKLECLAYIADSGCIEYSRMIAQLQLSRAKELMTQIPAISPWKEQFQEIAFDPFE